MTKSAAKKFVLGKIETTEGVDATPTVGANGILTVGLDASGLEGEQKVRELDGQFAGSRPSVFKQIRKPVSFGIEIAGSGVSAITVPAWMAWLRMCGFDAGVVGGTSVVQSPINPWAAPSMTLWPMYDNLKVAALGCRSNLQLTFEDDDVPMFSLSPTGFVPAGIVSEAVLGAVTIANQADPVLVSTANTTFSFDGYSPAVRRLTIDLGMKLSPRSLTGPADRMAASNREPTGNLLVEFPDLTTKNYYTKLLSRATGVLQVVHGTVAGNIVQVDAPKCEIGLLTTPTEDDFLMLNIPFRLLPNAGNDELIITSK
ncbi:MAG TPA: phage tail tube protein [Allosphingosinicella sp.]|nr:phage tail tube protein [Allosphingosinicella sp.]